MIGGGLSPENLKEVDAVQVMEYPEGSSENIKFSSYLGSDEPASVMERQGNTYSTAFKNGYKQTFQVEGDKLTRTVVKDNGATIEKTIARGDGSASVSGTRAAEHGSPVTDSREVSSNQQRAAVADYLKDNSYVLD